MKQVLLLTILVAFQSNSGEAGISFPGELPEEVPPPPPVAGPSVPISSSGGRVTTYEIDTDQVVKIAPGSTDGIRQCEGVTVKQCWLAQVNFDALDLDTIKVHDGTKMTKKPYDLGGTAGYNNLYFEGSPADGYPSGTFTFHDDRVLLTASYQLGERRFAVEAFSDDKDRFVRHVIKEFRNDIFFEQ